MPENKQNKKPRLVLTLDADKLGMVTGAFFATVVMAICFFRGVSLAEVAIRAGLTFVLVYAATFLLARIILRATLAEFVKKKKSKRSAGKVASEKAEAAETEEATGEEE